MMTTAYYEKFQKLYGISPVPPYPALWRDIGPDTEAARVVLPETEYAATPFQTRTNGSGGKAYFAPQPTVAALQACTRNLPVCNRPIT